MTAKYYPVSYFIHNITLPKAPLPSVLTKVKDYKYISFNPFFANTNFELPLLSYVERMLSGLSIIGLSFGIRLIPFLRSVVVVVNYVRAKSSL